jgi:hypothetical protein
MYQRDTLFPQVPFVEIIFQGIAVGIAFRSCDGPARPPYLILGEVYCSGCKQALLQNPSPFVQNGSMNFAVRIRLDHNRLKAPETSLAMKV